MSASDRRESRRAWVAAVLPPMIWFSFEQGLGTVVRLACESGGPPLGPLFGLAALAACAIAAWLAWRQARAAYSESHERARSFLALIALGEAGLFGLAIVFQTLATLIVPPCVR